MLTPRAQRTQGEKAFHNRGSGVFIVAGEKHTNRIDHHQVESFGLAQFQHGVQKPLPLGTARLAGEGPTEKANVVAEAQLAAALAPVVRPFLGDDGSLAGGNGQAGQLSALRHALQ